MSRLDELLQQYCPNGVEYKPILSVLSQAITDGPHETPTLLSEGVPFISVASIHNGIVDVSKCQGYISKEDSSMYRQKYCPMTDDVYMVKSASIGKVAMVGDDVDFDIWSPIAAMRCDKTKMLPRFLFHVLQTDKIQKEVVKKSSKGSQPNLSMRKLEQFSIPVPPLPVQEEIVRVLDEYTTQLNALKTELEAELLLRRQQYNHYRSAILKFDADVPMIPLSEVGPVCMCKRIMKAQTNPDSGVPFYKIGTFGQKANAYISQETYDEYREKYNFPKKGDVLISAAGTIGRTVVYDGESAYFQDSNIVWIDNDETKLLNEFLVYCYAMKPWKIQEGGTIARLYNDNILNAMVPMPTIDQQYTIIENLKSFDDQCNMLFSDLSVEITNRQKQYEYYRDKLLSFEPMT